VLADEGILKNTNHALRKRLEKGGVGKRSLLGKQQESLVYERKCRTIGERLQGGEEAAEHLTRGGFARQVPRTSIEERNRSGPFERRKKGGPHTGGKVS